MVLQKEFRIVMPFSLEQYNIGQRYSAARMSKEATEDSGGKDGVELVETKPYKDEKTGQEGIYTYKIYYLEGYVPGWLKKVLPDTALQLHEKSWNAYPICKTELTCPFLGERFQFTIDSVHVSNDWGMQQNIHNLTKEQLKERQVSFINIGTDRLIDKKHNVDAEDPAKVKHSKAKIKRKGPLSTNWQKEIKANPKDEIWMCCYKLVTVKFKYPALASKVESYMISSEREIFLRFHRLIFCWLDDWCDMSLPQAMEEENKLYAIGSQAIKKDLYTLPSDGKNVLVDVAIDDNGLEENGKDEENATENSEEPAGN